MSTAPVLRRWCSPSSSVAQGFELLGPPLAPDAVGTALADLRPSDIEGGTFLFVRLATTSHGGVSAAMATVRDLVSGVRVCLAIDRTTLDRVDSGLVNSGGVGLALDDVDEDTPLSAIARNPVEAIRFRAEFVARASRSLRLGCVLESMLLLARNLGICTTGPSTAASDNSISPTPIFDYVPWPLAVLPVDVAIAPRLACADGRPVPAEQFSR
jgi:hypothetical protein